MLVPADATHALVEWLDGRAADVARVGGKAASLDRLASFGFRIPPGFCLTTEAFAEQVLTLPGGDRVAADAGILADPRLRSALVDAMQGGPLAPMVAAGLDEPLQRLATELSANASDPLRLAVRSSGVAEDGAAASFAGLHDTELDLTADEVPAAILRCWASLWSDRAIGYRTRRGLPLDGGRMAVVVQALVPAVAAAVAFTRHPVTGREDQIVVNAAPGLGEDMVSGLVTPDMIVIDKASGTIVESTPGDQPAGPALSDAALVELVTLCLEVEQAFGAAVDIEAALASDGWYLLQARPITTR
jgi:phosphoenolpyruvate synthase/pyruvate phosphate dikinase